MALCPGTPKVESRNCPGLDSLRTPPAHTGIGSIPNFLWSGVKLPIWLPALLSTITCAANVQMANARPFRTSTFQELSNGIKNTSRQGVLTSTIELWSRRSPGGLQVPTFGSVSLILTLTSKWGCDTLDMVWCSTRFKTLNPKIKMSLVSPMSLTLKVMGQKLSNNPKFYHMLLNGKLHLMMNIHISSKTKHGHWMTFLLIGH
jgi:hypothetical protein